MPIASIAIRMFICGFPPDPTRVDFRLSGRGCTSGKLDVVAVALHVHLGRQSTVPPNSAAKSAAIFGSQPSSRTVEGIRQTELMSVHTDVRELAGFTLLRPLRWWRRGWRRWRGLGVRSDKTRHCGTDRINRLRTPCLAALSCRFSFWRLPALSFHCRLLACFLMAVDRATIHG
jgi:hypothetical protein